MVVSAIFLTLVGLAPLAAAQSEPTRGEVVRLVSELDSDQFRVRQEAAERLRRLVERPELGPLLAEEFQRVLISTGASFEVRKQLKSLGRALPTDKPLRAEEVSLAEVDRLIGQLDDDAFGVRQGARERLEWLLGHPKMACPILLRMKARKATGAVTLDAQRWVEPVYQKSRQAWLLSDPAGWQLPAVSDAQIEQWCDELVAAEHPAGGGVAKAQLAAAELRDVMARDAEVGRVKSALTVRLSRAELVPAAALRVQELLDLTRPAMVAEFWERATGVVKSRPRGAQHLLVGVPQMGPGARRPSHFDRIDDRVAHCVSGHNLSPGEYPVGVALPHPNEPPMMFQLVNLDSPRRRMAYEYYVQLAPATQLADLSRRTFDWLLRRKQSLTVRELMVVRQLDSRELSRFAGRFFQSVEDSPLSAEEWSQPTVLASPPGLPLVPRPEPAGRPTRRGLPSRHAMICQWLAADGTQEAAAELLRAIAQDRFLPPTADAPYRLEWIAAVAIAARDPWPGVDDWLAGLTERNDVLIAGQAAAAELSATAAALLLTRHQQAPEQFGLAPAADALLTDLGVHGQRYVASDGRGQVQRWWAGHQEKQEKRRGP